MHPTFESLSQRLANAWREGTTVAVPAADAAPRTRADAFAVQDRMAAILRDRCVGWKVAAAAPAYQRMEGYEGPYVGRLFAERHHVSPATLPAAMFARFIIECEFAFRFKAGVPARKKAYARTDLDPVLVFHPGIEIAGFRYADSSGSRTLTSYDLIADNGAAAAYVEGRAIDDWRGIDFASLRVDARIDDGVAIEMFTGEYRRDPLDILLETVNELSARGISLAPGELVSTGAVTKPAHMGAGQTFVASFGDLGTLRLSFD
jgi:2-keto-4-pentenoate hydratase